MNLLEQDEQKKMACLKALPYIKDSMIIGLGTGSTINIFLDILSKTIKKNNINISAITSSEKTREKAKRLGIKLIQTNITSEIDLYIDGTDEFDDDLNLIKGGGGALLGEKIVASCANKVIIIADETKYSSKLGSFPLPVEIVDFETGIIIAKLNNIHARYAVNSQFTSDLRKNPDGSIFRTDMGHVILDIPFKEISKPENLSAELLKVAGIVDHGLFLKQANIILTEKRILSRN